MYFCKNKFFLIFDIQQFVNFIKNIDLAVLHLWARCKTTWVPPIDKKLKT